MKKIITSLCLLGTVLLANAQTVLNEIYTDPGNGKSEFFELYNSSTLSGAQNVDCYTIMTYRNYGGAEGWYIMDLPNLTVNSKSFFVGAAASPFNVQQLSAVVPNFNWNDAAFRSGSTGGSLVFAQLDATRTSFTTTAVPNPLNDFIPGGNGKEHLVLVFVNGVFSNSFIGGQNSGSIPSYVSSMPALTVNYNCGGSVSSFFINFSSTLKALENVISMAGSDNGYARTSDGICGTWVKTSNSPTHTPGVSNGTGNTVSSLTTAEVPRCGFPSPSQYTITYDITAIAGVITEATDFPVEVQFYEDKGTVGGLGFEDLYLGSGTITSVAAAAQDFTLNRAPNILVVYKTQRGCFDKVASVTNSCITLPVAFTSFNASRNAGGILLNWKTAYEQNNRGFDIERNNNGNWEKIGFVASLGLNGNSSSDLSYSFVDRNNSSKGISQYRLRQVDIDAMATYSDVRAVRGEGQIGKITIYPNPTADGKVNIVFDDANVVRTVSVTDMSGRMVKEVRAVSNNNITISNLQSGMYTVKISVPETGEQVVQKIVVNKR